MEVQEVRSRKPEWPVPGAGLQSRGPAQREQSSRFGGHNGLRTIVTALVDGYPLRQTDPNFGIHELIDGMLENCRAMRPTHPTLGELYPELFPMQDRSSWLSPSLERNAWTGTFAKTPTAGNGRPSWDQ